MTERWQEIARERRTYDMVARDQEVLPLLRIGCDSHTGPWVDRETHDKACKRIAELEALLAQETANNTILEAKLAYRDSAQVTHSEECWRVHHGCAVRKVEELARASSDDAEAKFRAQIHALEAKEQRDKLRELLREVAGSGVELETRKYLTVQVSPETWARVQEEAKRDPVDHGEGG